MALTLIFQWSLLLAFVSLTNPFQLSLNSRHCDHPSPSFGKHPKITTRLPFSLGEDVEDRESFPVNEKRRTRIISSAGNNESLIDNMSRRQLLLAMLASAGASSSILSNPAMASEQTMLSTEEASVANSLRGDGNTKLVIPPMDKRKHDTMTLDNGLRVILCSDPSSFSAAAAMDVHVGAASDPDTVPGLAHFCEVSGVIY